VTAPISRDSNPNHPGRLKVHNPKVAFERSVRRPALALQRDHDLRDPDRAGRDVAIMTGINQQLLLRAPRPT
jgi:hypothetical protein